MKQFLYYILKEDGRSGKVVNGVVTYTGTPTPLPQTPDGWASLQIAWERSITDHGVIRNFSLPFGFVRDGMKIIRDALYNQSIEEKILLLIQELTLVLVPGISYNWLYDYLYRGELDLSASEDTLDMIHVPCMEGGLSKLLKANRATKYTYNFDLDAVNVVLDGILLQENSNYVLAGTISNAVFLVNHTLPITFVNKDGTSVGTAFFTQTVEDVTPSQSSYVGASTNYFIINNSGISQTYNIKGKVIFICTDNVVGANAFAYRWLLVKNDNTEINVYNSTTAIQVGTRYEVDVDINFTLDVGEKMFLIGRFFGNNPSAITVEVDFLKGSELNVTFESTATESTIKAYTKDVLFKKLVGSVCGDETLASSALCELWKYIVVTSGDAIRGLSDAQITTSLDDFFKDMDSTFMAGIGIDNGNIEIESRTKYYDYSDPVDLGNIKDLAITPATDFIANKFKPGHPKPDIEDINGKFDPNGSDEFSGPYTKVVKDYMMLSPYKAGPFEIESLRLNLDGKITTDDNRDNSVYVINCMPLVPIIGEATFVGSTPGYIILSGAATGLAAGNQIQITGSALNDGIYNVFGVGITIISVSGTLVAEGPVNVTITIIRGGVLTLNRPAYTILEGVPNDTIFNIEKLTPKRMLLEHGRWIKSMHYGLDDKLLEFNSGDKNTELITELDGVTIDEDADVQISSLGDIMFLPFIATFGTETPSDLVNILESSPNRCFTCYDEARDIQITGFLMAAGFAPNDLKEQEFRLLLSPNNDLNLLP